MSGAHNQKRRNPVGITGKSASALCHADEEGQAGGLPKACYPLRVKFAWRVKKSPGFAIEGFRQLEPLLKVRTTEPLQEYGPTLQFTLRVQVPAEPVSERSQ